MLKKKNLRVHAKHYYSQCMYIDIMKTKWKQWCTFPINWGKLKTFYLKRITPNTTNQKIDKLYPRHLIRRISVRGRYKRSNRTMCFGRIYPTHQALFLLCVGTIIGMLDVSESYCFNRFQPEENLLVASSLALL